MKKIARQAAGKTGFTMVEIIAVLLILGIVAAVVVSRMDSTGSYDLSSQAEVIKGHLRYAQTRAMNSNQVWGINFSSSTAYSLFQNGSTANRVILPGQDADIVTIPGGVSVTTGIVSFDAWGKPCTDAAGTTTQSGLRTLTVSKDGATQAIEITPNTGFMP